MTQSTPLRTIPVESQGGLLVPRLVEMLATCIDSRSLLKKALPELKSHLACRSVAVTQGVKGAWRTLSQAGGDVDAPMELLSDVLDRGEPSTQGDFWAAPLERGPQSSELLVLEGAKRVDSAAVESLAAALSAAMFLADRYHLSYQRAGQRAALLEMLVQWNKTRETSELLRTMAETSTNLLQAERATIFLLNPDSGELVGRPALGVEGGELRLSRDTGVVGQVVRSGEPARVDEDIADEQAQVDRGVDSQLGFKTRSLLCVPIFGADGGPIGAFELINKRGAPFSKSDEEALMELAAHAAIAIENNQHVEHLENSRRQVADEAAHKVRLIGESEPLQKLRAAIGRVAHTDLAVLVLGENGTGKEVVAQLIHYLSDRRDNVLVAVNCAAISETLLESELFGHEKGAFTDAHQAREGKFELAHGGTLFLDEIGDMSLGGQAKLLRVLEEKLIVRVGGSTPIATDARVIAATNQDLAQLVRDGKFREDLFFRLNVVTLAVPALRERGEDIALLSDHFLQDFCSKARRPVPKFSAAARRRLLAHSWPGNVRELRNMMERLAYLSTEDRVDAEDLSFVMAPKSESDVMPTDLPLTEATQEFQAKYIKSHVDRAGGNMTEAAARLGLHRSNLYRKLKQLGVDEPEDVTPN